MLELLAHAAAAVADTAAHPEAAGGEEHHAEALVAGISFLTPGFFVALHVGHLAEWCPRVVPYLALPPGYRVLLAPEYEDVWFDESLPAV